MLTAYDFTFASILDEAGIDVLLVGDSASNVMARPWNHASDYARSDDLSCPISGQGINHCLVVVDLPFGSYQGNSKRIESSIRIMKESGAHAVKLEGGSEVSESVRRITSAGIPVMGHLGLTPQSIYKFGTYTVRAKDDDEAEKLRIDARKLEQAGCFAIVLEKIPAKLAMKSANPWRSPPLESGPVPVLMDRYCNPWLSQVKQKFSPRFLRRYLNLHDQILETTL